MSAPAGWYREPDDPTHWRYWDGQQWTEHRSPVAGSEPAEAVGATDSEETVGAGGPAHQVSKQQSTTKGVLVVGGLVVGVLIIGGGLAALDAMIGDGDSGGDVAVSESSPAPSETRSTTSATPSSPSPTPSPSETSRTPSPTASPTPSATATRLLPADKANQLTADLMDELGESNRGFDPRVEVSVGPGPHPRTVVRWAVDENITEGLTKDELRLEATEILQTIRERVDWNYTDVLLSASYPLVNQLGKSKESKVFSGVYTNTLIDRINFDAFYFKDVDNIGRYVFVHPAFQY
jgi:hypothetical protein